LTVTQLNRKDKEGIVQGRTAQTGDPGQRCDCPMTQRLGIRRGYQSTLPLIQIRAEQSVFLTQAGI
jgi:hypothetical protein